jgi:hypothetical protein
MSVITSARNGATRVPTTTLLTKLRYLKQETPGSGEHDAERE